MRFLVLVLLLLPFNAVALSDYGYNCSGNWACLECRKDTKCMKCIHNCWNAYGYADSNKFDLSNITEEALCNLRRAKWCKAQCWDPDDKEDPEYVSTKPDCHEFKFPVTPMRGGRS